MAEASGSATERGTALLVRGRLLDLRPDYSAEAEALLTRAVPALPSRSRAAARPAKAPGSAPMLRLPPAQHPPPRPALRR